MLNLEVLDNELVIRRPMDNLVNQTHVQPSLSSIENHRTSVDELRPGANDYSISNLEPDAAENRKIRQRWVIPRTNLVGELIWGQRTARGQNGAKRWLR